MGHNIFEFTHPCDHEEIRSNLRLTAGVCVCVCVCVCVSVEQAFAVSYESSIQVYLCSLLKCLFSFRGSLAWCKERLCDEG